MQWMLKEIFYQAWLIRVKHGFKWPQRVARLRQALAVRRRPLPVQVVRK